MAGSYLPLNGVLSGAAAISALVSRKYRWQTPLPLRSRLSQHRVRVRHLLTPNDEYNTSLLPIAAETSAMQQAQRWRGSQSFDSLHALHVHQAVLPPLNFGGAALRSSQGTEVCVAAVVHPPSPCYMHHRATRLEPSSRRAAQRQPAHRQALVQLRLRLIAGSGT